MFEKNKDLNEKIYSGVKMDSLTLAIILGLWGFITGLDAYSTKSLLGLIPLLAGFVTGLILGNIIVGAYVGAFTQLLSLGLIPIGGAVPPDFAIIAVLATALIITGNLDITMAAVVVAALIPAGIFSMYLDILARTVNVSIIRKAEALISKGEVDSAMKWHFAGLLSLAGFRGLAYFISALIALTWGVKALQAFLRSMPIWVLRGLSVAGAILPALGLGILISFLGVERRYLSLLIPFFIVALISFGYTFGFVLIVAGIVAWIKIRRATKGTQPTTTEKFAGKFDKALLRSVSIRSGFLLECSWNYERMQALGYLFSIMPILKRIYKDKEELKRAALFHLEFFNTNPFLAPIILGIDTATEETRPGDFELIRSIKTGLMGTFAGLGDSLIYLVIGGILLILGSTLSLMAPVNPMLAWTPLLVIIIFDAIFIPFRIIGTPLGYRKGLKIVESFSGERIKILREIFEWLAVVSIGSILPIVITVRILPLVAFLQPIDLMLQIISLNQLLGSIVGLLLTFFAFYLRRKGYGPIKIFAILFSLGFLLGAVGILSVVAETMA